MVGAIWVSGVKGYGFTESEWLVAEVAVVADVVVLVVMAVLTVQPDEVAESAGLGMSKLWVKARFC